MWGRASCSGVVGAGGRRRVRGAPRPRRRRAIQLGVVAPQGHDYGIRLASKMERYCDKYSLTISSSDKMQDRWGAGRLRPAVKGQLTGRAWGWAKLG